MRLINTTTLLFEEFIGGRSTPRYAILSHTWEEEEVTFADVASNPLFRNKKGWGKIAGICWIASRQGYQYAWVDTCCIDKSSSAELTEAINSMFKWYEAAGVCYVFLSDLADSTELDTTTTLAPCRWFTRGWTLQELIAPRDVVFFNQAWNQIGTKTDLIDQLRRITGIGHDVLTHSLPLRDVAVAEKMSWAAYRETTRIEDMAYCLLGIFDVNMPLLYGEGNKAFRRLQDEIIRSTPDLSILAWTAHPREMTEQEYSGHYSGDELVCGVIAESPRWFARCGSIRRLPQRNHHEFVLTHAGLKIQWPLFYEENTTSHGGSYGYVLDLGCYNGSNDDQVGIRLRKCGHNQFLRIDPGGYSRYQSSWTSEAHLTSFMGSATEARYLITDLFLLGTRWTESGSVSDIWSLTRRTRHDVIQVKRPSWGQFYDAWPSSGFDLHDEVFFTTTTTVLQPSAMLRLRGRTALAPPDQQRSSESGTQQTFFDVVIFATDWGFGYSSPKCSIVDYQTHAHALATLQSELRGFVYHSNDHDKVEQMLQHCNIPKTSKAWVNVPKTNLVGLISFTLTSVRDLRVAFSESFWRIEFHCEFFPKDSVPALEGVEGKWLD